MATVGIVTVSDRAFRGEREDAAGPAVKRWAEEQGYTVSAMAVVPDEKEEIARVIVQMSDAEISLILTAGGTGFAPRDVTPEATRSVLEREAPGLSEAMRRESARVTPFAALSRAVAGIRGKSLIVNLPGSPRAAIENLSCIKDVIPHALDLIRGEVRDCARESS